MMTYEEYQKAIIENQEAMSENRRQEIEERRRFEDERSELLMDAREEYKRKTRGINFKIDCKQKHNAQLYKERRTKLYMEHTRIVMEFREQNGIQPPYVPLPESDNQEKGGEA